MDNIEIYKNAIKELQASLDYGISEYIGTQSLELVMEVAKKEIPQKVVKYDKYYFKCPICGIDIGVSEEDLTIYEVTPPNYCQNCGQALDWSETK